MKIQMIGIDHNKASLDQRAIFSLTKSNACSAMESFLQNPKILGCIILSTCNRLEIWTSVCDDFSESLIPILCNIKKVDVATYQDLFLHREDEKAITHLFQLSAGLKSQILGEDQILTQVKDALSLARENGLTDSILEVLFRTAITSGKRVKTEVVVSRENVSLADEVIVKLKENGTSIAGKTCMVIGNGLMGQLMASHFLKEGAKVLVTLREYKHKKNTLAKGAIGIPYDQRHDFYPNCDFIVSATSSPHLTVKSATISSLPQPTILIDLAVPRDIDVQCKLHPNVTLFDVDDFKITQEMSNQEALSQSKIIIEEEIANFHVWQSGVAMMPKIQAIKEEVAQDMVLRMKSKMKKLDLEENTAHHLELLMDVAAQNAINKLLFGLKKHLSHEEYEKCLKGIEKSYA